MSGDTVYRLLKLRRGEGRKVLEFALLGALLQAGVSIGLAASDALFLTHLGPAKLPLVYLLLPLVMIVFTPVFSFLGARFGIARLFDLVAVAVALGGIGIFALLSAAPAPGALFAVKLWSAIWFFAVYTLFWNFIDGFFDILDAKRLYALFSGGQACGAMLGGGLVSLIAARHGVALLYLVWSALAVSAAALAVVVRRRHRRLEELHGEDEVRFWRATTEAVRAVRRSPFVQSLFLALTALVFLITVCEYQYLEVFSKLGDERALASLFGRLGLLVGVFNLVVNFFLVNRIVMRFGVRNTVLVQPLAMMAVFALFTLHGGFTAAVFGFFVYQGLQTTVDNNNWNFVFNAVRGDLKAHIRAFAEGLCEPLATSLAGLFLLVWAPRLPAAEISTLALGLAAIQVLLALRLRHHYAGAMILNLRRSWLDFAADSTPLLERLDSAEVEALVERLRGGDRGNAALAAELLWRHDRALAAREIVAYLARATEAEQGAFQPLVHAIVAEADNARLGELLAWAAATTRLAEPLREELAEHGLLREARLAETVRSAPSERRASAAVALWHSPEVADNRLAIDTLDELLRGEPGELRVGLHALGAIGGERHGRLLVRHLEDADPGVRLEALRSLGQLASPRSARLIAPLLEVVVRRDGAERRLAMEALAAIGSSECVVPLLAASRRFSPAERRQAERLVLRLGLRAVPVIVAVLRDPEQFNEGRSIAARCLARLAFPQLEAQLGALIALELERAYLYLANGAALAGPALHRGGGEGPADRGPGTAVLYRFYRDVERRAVAFVLEMLAIGGRLPDWEMLSSALRSASGKARADAIETIEQTTGREVFELLLPLVDSRDLAERVRFWERRYGGELPDPGDVVRAALASRVALECAAAAQALWETMPAAEAAPLLRRRVRGEVPGGLRQVVASLLAPPAGGRPLNLVERLDALTRPTLLSRVGLFELAALERTAREQRHAAGSALYRRGEPATALYCLVAGVVEVRAEGASRRCGAGELCGEAALFGARHRLDDAVVVAEARVLQVDLEAVRAAADAAPGLGLDLALQRLESSRVA